MKDFDETKGLDQAALSALLATGDERDRVLAIWALALRSTAASAMATQLRGEPDPGVRRALCVVLASHGELDLVVAMSRHDPSAVVRASAVQMVVRFAAAGRVPWSLVAERFTDVPVVRASVASQIDANAPAAIRASLVALVTDDDESVRREAFESCAKLAKTGVLPRDRLREALDAMRDGECANALSIWFGIEELDVVGAALDTASISVRRTAAALKPQLMARYIEVYEEAGEWLPYTFPFAEVAIEKLLAYATKSPHDVALIELTERLRRLDRLPTTLRPAIQHFARAYEAARAPDESESSELALAEDLEHEAESIAAWEQHDAALRAELARLL
ncbi:MAG TPA: hypothetical protein VGM90_15790 [Kofleriaceae bacterium]